MVVVACVLLRFVLANECGTDPKRQQLSRTHGGSSRKGVPMNLILIVLVLLLLLGGGGGYYYGGPMMGGGIGGLLLLILIVWLLVGNRRSV